MPAPTLSTAAPSAHLAATGAAPFRAAELRAELAAAGADLDRLQALLADACGALLASFEAAQAQLGAASGPAAPPAAIAGTPAAAIAGARHELASAVVALQFEDIASQLIAHAQRRLRGCAERLASTQAAEGDTAGGPPHRSSPVGQRAMDAGAVELF